MPAGNVNLFPTYPDRASYRATGKEAPVAVPDQPLKTWADPAPPAPGADGMITYYRLPLPNSGEGSALIPFKVPASLASVLNLPGAPVFPAYAPAPSGGVVAFPNGGTETIPAIMLSTRAQADAYAAQFSTPAAPYSVEEQLTENGAADGLPFEYMATELRRIYNLVGGPNGPRLNVGRLIAATNVNGVGAPGHWDMANVAGPTWIADPVNAQVSSGAPVPVPAQPLGPNQRVVYYDFFGFQIVAYATIG